MDINLAILPEAVTFARLDTKAKVLGAVARSFASAYGLDEAETLERLEQREVLGSTGFGRAIAIPHCRSTGVKRPTLALIKLEAPVDFASPDALPVALVFGLVSPENAGATHLHALAAISRLTRDEAMMQTLMDAATPEELYTVLTNQFLRDAA
ncbi:MAG: PTS sugar transporter subunit IIA [Erythrobacter sp.]